jgi:hypothetical protein
LFSDSNIQVKKGICPFFSYFYKKLFRTTVIVKLSNCNSLKDTVQYSACDSFITPKGQVIKESGWYWEPVQDKINCDSLILYKLDIGHTRQEYISKTVCKSFTTGSGKIITMSGIYLDTTLTQGAIQCDSFITYNLIINSADARVTQTENKLLAINKNASSYQWYNCNTHSIISGAIDTVYNITTAGAYALIVNENGCADTSVCMFPMANSTLINNKFSYLISPNPNNIGKVNIQFSNIQKEVIIQIYNAQGILLFIENKTIIKDISVPINFAKGIYLIKIKTETGIVSEKIVVE